jgi:hypothetical protein
MSHRERWSSIVHVLAVVAASTAVGGTLSCAAFPSSGRDGTIGSALSSSSGRLGLRVMTRGEIMAAAPGTYINQLLADRDSTLERWADRVDKPLRIWIDSSSTIGGSQAGYPAAVRAALRDWLSTGIPLRFAYVGSARNADIRVRWTDHLKKKTGSTTWRTDRGGWMLAGDILLATHISDGQPLDARGMRAIALHEMGHALGLSHSDDPSDVMAALVRVDSLSAPDRNTIKLLYTLPAGPVH